jgi:hypothetical protein
MARAALTSAAGAARRMGINNNAEEQTTVKTITIDNREDQWFNCRFNCCGYKWLICVAPFRLNKWV